MDINEKIQLLAKQIDKLQLQLDAICKHAKLNLDYKPHEYQVSDMPDEEEMNG